MTIFPAHCKLRDQCWQFWPGWIRGDQPAGRTVRERDLLVALEDGSAGRWAYSGGARSVDRNRAGSNDRRAGSAATNGGTGVEGTESGATSVGVFGTSAGSLGIGVEGIENSANGMGVEGAANGSAGIGVFGTALNKGVWGTGGVGVEGSTSASGGMGVLGLSSSAAAGYGVFGESDNQFGTGVHGVNFFGGMGVAGASTNIGVYGDSGSYSSVGQGDIDIGVWGDSALYTGVLGTSDQATGVYGLSSQNVGVYGNSFAKTGVYGNTIGNGAAGVVGRGGPGGYGVVAINTNSAGQGVWGETYGTQFSNGVGADAVHGLAHTTGGSGVAAINVASGGTGLFAATPDSTGDAGVFNGNVGVNGTLNAFSKNFKIDHPLDPTNKYLYHASVESSEMMTIYSGNATTDSAGVAVVQLPGWFETLNTDFRYQLTVLGQFAQAIIGREIENHQFTIRSSEPSVKVSWKITAVRQDAFAKAHPLVVEDEKSSKERGTYLDPKLYNAPMETGLSWARYRWPQKSEEPTNISIPVSPKKAGATPVQPQLPAQLAQQLPSAFRPR